MCEGTSLGLTESATFRESAGDQKISSQALAFDWATLRDAVCSEKVMGNGTYRLGSLISIKGQKAAPGKRKVTSSDLQEVEKGLTDLRVPHTQRYAE